LMLVSLLDVQAHASLSWGCAAVGWAFKTRLHR
jgi:hypothetical protein